MEKGLQNYGKDGYKGVTETWNIVQHELKCCGAQEYLDWENTTFAAESKSVPDSCCLSDVEGCGKGILSMAADQVPKIIHPNGCLSELKEVIEGNVAALGGIGVGIAIIQVSITVWLIYSFTAKNFNLKLERIFIKISFVKARDIL